MANLLFVTSSYPETPIDGVCGFVDDLARALVERHGHAARVLAPPGRFRGFDPIEVRAVDYAWPATRRLTSNADLGMAVRSSRARKVEAVALTTAMAVAARRSLGWADATISHWLLPSAMAAALAGASAHVAVAHGGDVHLLESMPGGRRFAGFIADRVDRIVCVSRDIEQRLVRLVPESSAKLAVVAMGASLGPEPDDSAVRRFRAEHAQGAGPVILFLGRLQPIKGVDVLLEAARRQPGVSIWIAGDGPEQARLLDQASAARLRVSFLGRIDRPTRRVALAACDAVVIPSRIEPNGRMEGTPVVCAESFAGGRPVIATRTGGLAEVVEDGVTGLLVAPDDPASLASAIGRFADDAALRRRLEAGVRAVAPRFDMDRTAESIDRLVAGVIAGGRRG